MYIYNHLICGGTFDHFHRGHRNFIDTAFKFGKKVTIGILKNSLNNYKLLASAVEDYLIRKKVVLAYLKQKNWIKRCKIIPLFDIFGNSLEDKSIEAIVVAEATYKNALLINRLRRKKKFPLLKVIKIKDVLANDGRIISSERIRAGEIDPFGHCYSQVFQRKKTLVLPDSLRGELRKPIGKVFFGEENKTDEIAKKIIFSIDRIKPTMVIAVGDIISMSLLKLGFNPDVKIIDFRSRRKEIVWKAFPGGTAVANSPGTISTNVVKKYQLIIKKYLKTGKKQLMIIKGEEDLVALPAILLAPLKSVVLYGQMDLGVVMAEVGEGMKVKVEKILKKFKL